jgi:hypothetical protein
LSAPSGLFVDAAGNVFIRVHWRLREQPRSETHALYPSRAELWVNRP